MQHWLLLALGGRDCVVATLTILKFSGRSQLIAMTLSFALGFLFCSYLFKKYRRNFVMRLVLVELLNIFNFLVKFISGRRILPYRSRMRKSNAKIKSVAENLLNINPNFAKLAHTGPPKMKVLPLNYGYKLVQLLLNNLSLMDLIIH